MCCRSTERGALSRRRTSDPAHVYDVVFADSGTFAYYCSIHGTKDAGMVGEIVVTP